MDRILNHNLTVGDVLAASGGVIGVIGLGVILFFIYAVWHVNKYGN